MGYNTHMRVILTHEQADFDALAALMGASMLQDGDLPVLPRKMNRNVRAFVSLYGQELDLLDIRDLPAEPIEQITLVDTQSLITLKGMTNQTKVLVIDHHSTKENIDPAWEIRCERVGAVTTLLVESLQENQISLSPIQATLLLLGIYEDTGSLAYASTTPRDIRSAAFLLEQGASLRLASGYLNPPLSPEQQKLYEKLLSNVQTHSIQSLKIITSISSGVGVSEEISSIAHKLRDLLEPDGLFIIVSTEEGYRMVMRSTSDYVNVAAIAAHFGGGGHERAAAALIRRKPEETIDSSDRLEEILDELKVLLPSYLHPPMVVGQIMSRRPRLIAPGIQAKDASSLMQKYGYEGFPVVENNQIVGLLTRRSVDRALAHKLNLTAASLMEAGGIFVSPSDSLEHLQQIMTDSGWGQIPVVDPDKQEIVGIVTRTDLLKVLAKPPANHKLRNLAQKLEDVLPPIVLKLLKTIGESASEEHMSAYIVGGFVRDLILEKPGFDFDIVIEGDAISLAKKLSSKYGGKLVCHSRFGTSKWYLSKLKEKWKQPDTEQSVGNSSTLPDSLDFITARTEFYDHPTALPTVERSSIKLDLHRRDFTINTLALRLDGRHFGDLLDFWGGYNDIRKGYVRVLHSLSFIDDPTRILRAIRFEQRFNFKIESRTLDLLKEASDQLKSVSGERIRHEVDLILLEDQPSLCFNRLLEVDLLHKIHPSFLWQSDRGFRLDKLLNQSQPDNWKIADRYWSYSTRKILAYCYLLYPLAPEEIKSIASRLRLPAQITRTIFEANRIFNDRSAIFTQKISQVTERLQDISPPALVVLSADVEPQIKEKISQFLSQWRHIEPGIDGHSLQQMGLPPGPTYRVLLREIKNAWLDGVIVNADQEQDFLQDLLSKLGNLQSNL